MFTQEDLKIAIRCMWISNFIGIYILVEGAKLMPSNDWIFVWIGLFLTGITWLLTAKLRARRNWARILTIIIVILEILGIVVDNNWSLTDLLVVGINISILMVLNAKQVGEWFRGVQENTTPTPETHVKCPDCRELVFKDAKKCKHCGTLLIPQ